MWTRSGTVLAAAAGFALLAATGLRAQETRQPVVLPAKARTQVLSEMRQMLAALNGVLTASVTMDRDRMAEAALSGGTRIAVDRDPAIVDRLPQAFVKLGSSVHRDFDALAETIRAGASRDTVLARMGSLTAKCVSCHASYRVVTPDEGPEEPLKRAREVGERTGVGWLLEPDGPRSSPPVARAHEGAGARSSRCCVPSSGWWRSGGW